jgi:hypothetical protein
MAGSDTGRGMMTTRQRELLTGERTYEGETKRVMSSECRQNIRSALRDFPLLFDVYKGEDFEGLIYPPKSPALDRNTILAGIAFLYKAAATHPDLEPETVLEDGVRHAEFDMGRDVSLDIKTEPLDAMEYFEVLERDGIVDSFPEALALLQSRTYDRQADDPHAKTYSQSAPAIRRSDSDPPMED